MDTCDMGIVVRRLHTGSECFDFSIEGREQLTDDLQVDRLEAMEGSVLKNPLASDVHREHIAIRVEECLRLHNDDFRKVIAAHACGEQARYTASTSKGKMERVVVRLRVWENDDDEVDSPSPANDSASFDLLLPRLPKRWDVVQDRQSRY